MSVGVEYRRPLTSNVEANDEAIDEVIGEAIDSQYIRAVPFAHDIGCIVGRDSF